MTRTASRRAVTLTEVLIAIFLMGIGLMAILSLFPLGAVQMAQAIQDQRAAEAATTAAAFARTIWKQTCDADTNDAQMKFYDSTNVTQQPFVMAMDNPNQGLSPSSAITAMQAMPRPGMPLASGMPSATGPSYPVLVDPIGYQANQSINTGLPNWVGYSTAAPQAWYIPRRTLFMADTTATVVPQPLIALGAGSTPSTGGTLQPSLLRIVKQFSLMDDMTFAPNGTPSPGTTTASNSSPVERQGRYSWAYMFRRGNNADRTAVDITTILYSGRSIDVASQETVYTGTGRSVTAAAGTSISPKQLTLTYNPSYTPKPALRRGGWVLDATLGNDDSGQQSPQGFFYRVVNVDDSTAGQVTLELQTPLLGGPSGTNLRSIVVMEKVVEVFTKKDVSNVAPPMPY